MEDWEERALELGVYPIDSGTLAGQLRTEPPDEDHATFIRRFDATIDHMRYRVAREDRLAALAHRVLAAGPVSELAPALDDLKVFMARHYPPAEENPDA